MPLSEDIGEIGRILQKYKTDTDVDLNKDIEILLSVFKCPVFRHIVTIEESLNLLKEELAKHPSLLPVDFDIDTVTGKLLLNVPPESNQLSTTTSTTTTTKNAKMTTPLKSNINSNVSNLISQSEPYELDNQVNYDYDYRQTKAEPEYVNIKLAKDVSLRKYGAESEKKTVLTEALEEASSGREIHKIQLYKPEGSSLGFSVVGLSSEEDGDLGIFVEKIAPQSIAARFDAKKKYFRVMSFYV